MEWSWLVLGLFIFAGFTLEAITGFGGTVIALALGAVLFPIGTLVTLLVPLSMGLGLAMVFRHRGKIDWRLLLRMVLPAMVAGTAIGYLARPHLDEVLLRRLFGALIVWFSAKELWRQRYAAAPGMRPEWVNQFLTLIGGVTHGLFASGGPLLVYALSGANLDKARFRVTLIVVWLALDSGLTLAFAVDGRLQAMLPNVLAYVPVVAIGMWVGEHVHHKVSERTFRTVIYVVLLVCGGVLLLPR